MQVNGWVLGIGPALALVTIAQAQVRQPTIYLPPTTGLEIAQLWALLMDAKAEIAKEQAE